VLCIKPVWNKQFDSFTNLNKNEVLTQIREVSAYCLFVDIKTIVNDSEIMKSLIEFCKTTVTSEPVVNTASIDISKSIFEEQEAVKEVVKTSPKLSTS
jgi:hypothetical protein